MDTNGSKGWEGGPLDCGGLEASSFCPLGLRGVVVLGEEGVIGEVGSPSLFDSFGFDRDERRLFGGGSSTSAEGDAVGCFASVLSVEGVLAVFSPLTIACLLFLCCDRS